MNLETKYRELDAAQKIKVCARLFQNAEKVLGITKPMTDAEKSAKAEQVKVLAMLLNNYSWLKVKAFAGLAEQAALNAQIAHVTPKLIIDYVRANEANLRQISRDILPELPAHIPPVKTDEERLSELPELMANKPMEGILFESLISNVYFPVLQRLNLVDAEKFNTIFEQEIAANKARFIGDKADIRTAGAFEKFIRGIDGGVYEADALRRAKYQIVKIYCESLNT